MHPLAAQARDTASEALLGNRNCVVKVDCAGSLHPVVDIEGDLGSHTTDG